MLEEEGEKEKLENCFCISHFKDEKKERTHKTLTFVVDGELVGLEDGNQEGREVGCALG
jgi:hypothetical protein